MMMRLKYRANCKSKLLVSEAFKKPVKSTFKSFVQKCGLNVHDASKHLRLILISLISFLVLTACGGSDNTSASQQTLIETIAPAVIADPRLASVDTLDVIITEKLPSKIAWKGETYASSINVSTGKGSTVLYSIVGGAPAGLTIDAVGNIRWPVAIAESKSTVTFNVVVQSSFSSASLTIPVFINLIDPNTLIDVAVTQDGGVFADKSGSYRITIPSNSLISPDVAGKIVLIKGTNARGQLILRSKYSGFKAGTSIKEVFPQATGVTSKVLGNLSLTSQQALSTVSEYPGLTLYGQLHEPQRKKSWGIDRETSANFYTEYSLPPTNVISDVDAVADNELYDTITEGEEVSVLRKLTKTDAEKPPVLFIHGFSATINPFNECPMSGYLDKDGTWGQANAIVNKLSATHQVYEFQWRTCQPFEAVATQLGLAINDIYQKNAATKKVTIMAHSMGGVLVSTLLQKKFYASKTFADDPSEKIQKVYFFDSPVSGIRRTVNPSQRFELDSGLPNGRTQDEWAISRCAQITCHQLGYQSESYALGLSEITNKYFNGLVNTENGGLANELVTGWDSFVPNSNKFSINPVLTDFPIRIVGALKTQSDESLKLEPGDGLIDNRGIALNIQHFQHNGTLLPESMRGTNTVDISPYMDLHYLQRYYRKKVSEKNLVYPWVIEEKLTPESTNNVRMYQVLPEAYPSVKPIPSFVKYHFTNDYYAHTTKVFLPWDSIKYHMYNLSESLGVVSYDGSSRHLMNYFIAKLNADASDSDPIAVNEIQVDLKAKVINDAGTPVNNQPYKYKVSCISTTLKQDVLTGYSVTNADGSLNGLRLSTKCQASNLQVSIIIGDEKIYRQFEESVFVKQTGATYNATFNSGQDIRLLKLADLASKRDTDFVFLADLSGSYGDDLANFKSLSSALLNEIRDNGARVRVGIASFIDYPNRGGYTSDYPYKLESELSYDLAPANQAISSMVLGNGGDGPESQLEALYQLSLLPWNPTSQKIIMLATDATYHNSDSLVGYPGTGYAKTIAALKAKGILVFVVQPSSSAIPGLSALANDTAGRVLNAGAGSANIVCNVRNILNNSSLPCTSLSATKLSETFAGISRPNN
jgi:Integrin beta chain VWA domain/Alpha/beta hydrolase of unknown function (DUF900)